jgi:hypothetical protein
VEQKRSNFYPNGEIIDYSLPQSFQLSKTKEACGNCGLFKILMFATNGEKGSLKDNFMIFSLLWLNTKTKL